MIAHHNCLRPLLDHKRECASIFGPLGCLAHNGRDNAHAGPLARLTHDAPLHGIPPLLRGEEGDASCVGHRLPQELESFDNDFDTRINSESRDVSAWALETAGESK